MVRSLVRARRGGYIGFCRLRVKKVGIFCEKNRSRSSLCAKRLSSEKRSKSNACRLLMIDMRLYMKYEKNATVSMGKQALSDW